MMVVVVKSMVACLMHRSTCPDKASRETRKANGRLLNLDADMLDEVSIWPESLWIVTSFTPWCLHCPDYIAYLERLAQEFPESGPVHFAVLNCHVNRNFCDQLKLMGHPMVGFMYGGRLVPAAAVVYASSGTVPDPPALSLKQRLGCSFAGV